jgi:hypothetical protein
LSADRLAARLSALRLTVADSCSMAAAVAERGGLVLGALQRFPLPMAISSAAMLAAAA